MTCCIAPFAISPDRQVRSSVQRNTPPAPCRKWGACGKPMHRATVWSWARTWCEEPDFLRWFFLRGGHQESGPATAGLENAFLALEGAESADVGHREGHAELVLVARSQVETAVLYAQAAAIGVVGDLRLGVLKVAFTIVVIGAETIAPAAPVGGAVADHPAELVRTGGQNGIGLQVIMAERPKKLLDPAVHGDAAVDHMMSDGIIIGAPLHAYLGLHP